MVNDGYLIILQRMEMINHGSPVAYKLITCLLIANKLLNSSN